MKLLCVSATNNPRQHRLAPERCSSSKRTFISPGNTPELDRPAPSQSARSSSRTRIVYTWMQCVGHWLVNMHTPLCHRPPGAQLAAAVHPGPRLDALSAARPLGERSLERVEAKQTRPLSTPIPQAADPFRWHQKVITHLPHSSKHRSAPLHVSMPTQAAASPHHHKPARSSSQTRIVYQA